ncbi:MAG: cohesin domain-containing protein [Saprospiraceae bacterium]
MLRISLPKPLYALFILLSALAVSHFSFCQQDVLFDFETTAPNNAGDIITAKLKVDNFTDIVSMQISMNWDPNELLFLGVGDFGLPNLSNGNFGGNSSAIGQLICSWNAVLAPVSVSACSSLFTVTFKSLNGQPANIEISNIPVISEIVNVNFVQLSWLQTPLSCNGVGSVQGQVFMDTNNDCLFDLGEDGKQRWKVKFQDGSNTFFRSTDANGNYSISLPEGVFEVSAILPNDDIWESCVLSQTITVDNTTNETVDFPVQPLLDCALMSVDLSTPMLRRCFNSNYHVQYCNEGTVSATGVYVEIEFDDFLTVQGSSIPWTTVNGNTYTFPLGDVETGQCGEFSVQVLVSCNAVLGQTHCTSAHIFPDAPCVPTALWDGSNLEITGACDGDSVRFEIINIGDDMAEPLEFIVIEDDMIHLTSDPILLLSQQSINLAVPANGSTWRVEMPETPNNPYGTFTTEAIEGCGTNSGGSFSLGFVTQFPLDEQSLAIDVDCQENIGSFDPNDKTGYPKGFCAAHYIRADQDIEYKIRFQNTGTDTAFNIIIIDTLSNFLSPASVRPGSSSHPYEFELLGEGVVKFSFPNAMLPDSNTNEPASHGFVKFTVSPQPNIPMGAVIENYAAIYFDFNNPVYTNTYRHTVGDDFVEMQGFTGDLNVSGYVRNWYDSSPVEGVAMTMTNLCPVFTDSYGYYLFEGIDTADYELSAFKNLEDASDKVTVLDLLKYTEIILGISPVVSYYQQVAADVNGSNYVTTFDFIQSRKQVLGISTNQQILSWVFLRSNFDVANPDGMPSNKYTYSPLEMSLDGQDFIAIQHGNVMDESMVESVPINVEFMFEPLTEENGQIRVNVKAKNYTKVNAFQFSLKWDGALLEFNSIEDGALDKFTPEWRHVPAPGIVNLAYLQGGEKTVAADETLFTLVFDVLAPNGANTQLALDETNMPLQVVVDTCKLASASVTPVEIIIMDPNAVVNFEDLGLQVKIVPNPVQQGHPINLEVMAKEARSLQIQLFDLSGTAVDALTIQCPVGKSLHTVQQSLPKGIYFLKVKTERGKELSTKVVVF